jgi:hypothetical protein
MTTIFSKFFGSTLGMGTHAKLEAELFAQEMVAKKILKDDVENKAKHAKHCFVTLFPALTLPEVLHQ